MRLTIRSSRDRFAVSRVIHSPAAVRLNSGVRQQMKIFAIALVASVALWLLWRVNKRPRAMTQAQFIEILEAWVQDTLSPGEWDYFECCQLRDPKLEAVRVHCTRISLDPACTVSPPQSWALNDHGRALVRQLILELGGHTSAAA